MSSEWGQGEQPGNLDLKMGEKQLPGSSAACKRRPSKEISPRRGNTFTVNMRFR